MPGQCGAAMTMMTANGSGKRLWAVEVTRKALGQGGLLLVQAQRTVWSAQHS
jgi:hypothetical protein